MLYGNQVEAGYHFIRGLRLNPKDERGYHAVAYLASGRGKRRSARRVLELGLKQVPGSKLLRDALQSLTSAPSAKDTPEAREQRAVFEQASERVKGPRTREALELMNVAYKRGMRATVLNLAISYAKDRQKEKAQELARRLVDNLPTQHPFLPAAQALLGNGAPRPSLWKVKSSKGK